MSFEHHKPAKQMSAAELLKRQELLDTKARMLDQMFGRPERRYPGGRMGDDDEGELAYAVAADPKNATVIIRFGKPVEWVGLGASDVEALRDKLTETLAEIR